MQRQNSRCVHPYTSLPVCLGRVGSLLTWNSQTEICDISRESAPDVDSWIANAQSLQDDIETSRRLAVDIVQQAKAEETREETIREKAIYQDFLTKEASFNAALLEALRLIQTVNNCLDTAEQMIGERRILDALDMLEGRAPFLHMHTNLVANWLQMHCNILPKFLPRRTHALFVCSTNEPWI